MFFAVFNIYANNYLKIDRLNKLKSGWNLILALLIQTVFGA